MGRDVVEDDLNVARDVSGAVKGGRYTRWNIQWVRASKHDGDFSMAAFVIPFVSC